MKKTLIGLCLCFLLSLSTLWAETDPLTDQTSQPNKESWVFQLNLQTGFPTDRLSNEFVEGWGIEGSVGYRFAQNWTLSVEGGNTGYGGKSGSPNTLWNITPLLVKGQYNFNNGSIQPFVFAGLGMAFNSQTSALTGPSGPLVENDLLEEAGLGMAFQFMPQIYFFIQGKIAIDDTSSAYAPDQPTFLIPVDFGITFSMD